MITKNQGLMFTKPLPGSTHDTSRSFTIIPFSIPREEAPLGYGGSEVVTEMWIERCIAANSTFNPREMVMCKPMPGPFPRPCNPSHMAGVNNRSTRRRNFHYWLFRSRFTAYRKVDHFTRGALLR